MMELQAGQQVRSARDVYEIVAPLGRGGFGVTWRARRASDGREVVVKQLRLERVGDWKAVELFEREARVLQGLNHPRIPACQDFFHEADHCFLIQTLIPGQPLSALMRQGQRLSSAQMMQWFTDILNVLVYLHEQVPPVIHRDINPKNIMLEPNGSASLIDFGAVQAALSSGHSVASTSAGTFGYSPAEQFVGRATPRSDLYSLAMSYLAVQTGQEPERLPFSAGRIQVREALRGHDIDARLQLALEQMTEQDETRRPPSARDVLSRLQGVGAPAAAPAPSGPIKPVPVDGPIDWQAARQVCEQLGVQGSWGAPPPIPLASFESCSIAPDGSAAILCFYKEVYLLHVPTQRVHLLVDESILIRRKSAFSPDGRFAVVVDTYNARLHIIEIGTGGEVRVTTRASAAIGEMDSDMSLAISPDRSMMLAIGDGSWGDDVEISLVDLKRGAVESKMQAPCDLGASFSPDGQAIICVSHGHKTKVFGADGSSKVFPYIAFALSPDGRTAAHVEEDSTSIVLSAVESIYPLKLKALRKVDVTTLAKSSSSSTDIKRMRFSPDGARLVAQVYTLRCDTANPRDTRWRDELVVFDVAAGQATHLVLDPNDPNRRLDDLEDFAFSTDGRRLLVSARLKVSRYGSADNKGLIIYELGAAGEVSVVGVMGGVKRDGVSGSFMRINGRAVSAEQAASMFGGNVRIGGGVARGDDLESFDMSLDDDDSDSSGSDSDAEEDEESGDDVARALAMFAPAVHDATCDELPYLMLANGFFCRLDKDASIGAQPAGIYERGDVVRAVLQGKPVEAFLSMPERLALNDALLRRRILEGLIWRGALVPQGRWANLMDATRGMTHLLPYMMEQAHQRASARPRFGQQQASGGGMRVMATQLLEVAA